MTWAWLVLGVVIGTGPLVAQNTRVSSGFQPAVLRAGEYGAYLIAVEGDPGGDIRLSGVPEVEGLQIRYAGPSRQTTFINGQVSHRITYQFQVQAERPGDYTVPAFQVATGQQTLAVPAARLQVLEGGKQAEGNAIWAELELPRDHVYVGEAVLGTLKLYCDPDQISNVSAASNRPIHVKNGDAFTVGEFGNEHSQDVVEDGRRMREFTWNVVITPLKTGRQPLVIQMDLAVSARQARRSRGPFGDMFGPSLFDRMFNQQQVSLYTEDQEIDIRPLPTEGRPADFTGGIGMFSVDRPVALAEDAKEGEPLTLGFTVRGQGNFDRLQAPALAASDAWRDYPAEEAFAPADALGYGGVKTFDYTLIPREAGELDTPAIAFNFFNPDTAQYVELPVAGVSVSVAENPDARRPPPKARTPVAARRGPELLPIATDPGTWVSGIRPVVTSPAFLGVQAVPALALVFFVVRRRRQLRHARDPAYARRKRSRQRVAVELASARHCATAGQALEFYAAAQRAVQAAAGRHVEQAESLTAPDLARLAEIHDWPVEARETIEHFFTAGDAFRFGGVAASAADLASEGRRLEQTIEQIGGRR